MKGNLVWGWCFFSYSFEIDINENNKINIVPILTKMSQSDIFIVVYRRRGA